MKLDSCGQGTRVIALNKGEQGLGSTGNTDMGITQIFYKKFHPWQVIPVPPIFYVIKIYTFVKNSQIKLF